MSFRKCFSNWKPTYITRLPFGTVWVTTNWNSTSKFREMYDKNPRKNENVYCVNKAGVVLQALLGMCELPTDLNREEWQCLSRAEDLMCEKDISLSYQLSIIMSSIRDMNPHLFDAREKKKDRLRDTTHEKRKKIDSATSRFYFILRP